MKRLRRNGRGRLPGPGRGRTPRIPESFFLNTLFLDTEH